MYARKTTLICRTWLANEQARCFRRTTIGRLTNINLVPVVWICKHDVMYISIFRLPGFMDMDDNRAGERSWRNSEHICSLADSERHFGHVIRTELWNAYDATHPNEASDGFKYLGSFADLAAAMQAVESAVTQGRDSKVMHAGGGFASH